MRTARLLFPLIFGALASACYRDPPIVTTGLDAATAQQLLERLDRLIATMQASGGALPSQAMGAAAGTAQPDRVAATTAPELATTLARLEALERALAAGASGAGATAMQAVRQLPFARVPPRATALIQSLAVQLRDVDENADARQEARREFFRMPEQQVLQRLGMPDQVELGDAGRATWTFRLPKHQVYVKIADGIVADIDGWVERS